MECGHRSFVILAGILDGLSIEPRLLSHEATFGVGYGIVTYDITGKDPSRCYRNPEPEDNDPYVRLARQAIAYSVNNHGVMPIPSSLPDELLKERAGCFVSIHEEGKLRGCIGTIEPVYENVANEIVHNAYSASLRDPRFHPIHPVELDSLEINVDIMGIPEKIDDLSMLDVRKYGVTCTHQHHRGLLLPDLEGVDTVQKQLEIACSKGGFDVDDDITIERFEVIRHV